MFECIWQMVSKWHLTKLPQATFICSQQVENLPINDFYKYTVPAGTQDCEKDPVYDRDQVFRQYTLTYIFDKKIKFWGVFGTFPWRLFLKTRLQHSLLWGTQNLKRQQKTPLHQHHLVQPWHGWRYDEGRYTRDEDPLQEIRDLLWCPNCGSLWKWNQVQLNAVKDCQVLLILGFCKISAIAPTCTASRICKPILYSWIKYFNSLAWSWVFLQNSFGYKRNWVSPRLTYRSVHPRV